MAIRLSRVWVRWRIGTSGGCAIQGEWRPDSHNGRKQFGSLARHLLANYDVPAFMDIAWFFGEEDEARQQQGWFVHVGTGGNIRKADVPLTLTKKMAHLFFGVAARLHDLRGVSARSNSGAWRGRAAGARGEQYAVGVVF